LIGTIDFPSSGFGSILEQSNSDGARRAESKSEEEPT
jgi:hypothetical protein